MIAQQNDLVRTAIRKRILEMDPYQFEFLIADLLKTLGYVNVQVTKQSGDKGIDILADLSLEGITNVKTVVQVKRFKEGNNISGAIVAQLRGSAEVDQRGLVITTSDFTKDAIIEAKAANKMPVALVNGERLISLMIKNEVGVKKTMHPVYSVDSDYFDNDESEETTISPSSKGRGIWPLPGGINAYVDTLLKVLDAVKAGVDTRPKLIHWFMTTFDVVKSEKTAGGYSGVPRVIGLTQSVNGKVILTKEGETFLQSKNLDYLYDVFASNIFAVSELMEFMKTEGKPLDEEEIMEFLRENMNVEWKTFAQVNFRLLWLMNMGQIQRTGDGLWVTK